MRPLLADLDRQRAQDLYRTRQILDGPQGTTVAIAGRRFLSFCSNDYLGLAGHPALIEALRRGARTFGVGSGAAHLVSGHSRAHHELEEALAALTGRARALLFSTGYMANLGVLGALARRGDQIFEDRLNHASLLDAALLSRARLRRFPHGDHAALGEHLSRGGGERFVVTEGVFSMDGDVAALPDLASLARRRDAWLMVDDAHGVGVLGPQGCGTPGYYGLGPDEIPILVGTLGKACGTFGAFVAGSADLIETLIQHARTYVYTTALPSAVACATLAALERVREDEWRRDRLAALVARFRSGARELGLPLGGAPRPGQPATPILPLVLGDAARTLRVSAALRERGILVPAIRPPTVPRGSARLRITLSAAHTEDQIDHLVETLAGLV